MPSGERTTVLVVDDEPAVADMLDLFLRDEYDTRVAYGGEAALDRLDRDVDVVLLDRRMPVLSGDDVLSAIEDRGLRCRVVMVTAVDPDFDIVDMPFDDYLCKPVDRADVLEAVDRQRSILGYDDGVAELYSLASKVAAIESRKSEHELQAHEEYQRLVQRLEVLQGELSETVDEFEDAFAAI